MYDKNEASSFATWEAGAGPNSSKMCDSMRRTPRQGTVRFAIARAMDDEPTASNVQVTVRCRPMNRTETAAGNTSCFAHESDKVVLTHPSEGTRYEFVFDHMFDWEATQETVYNDSAAPILDKAFAGFNGTIFAYGQTGRVVAKFGWQCDGFVTRAFLCQALARHTA